MFETPLGPFTAQVQEGALISLRYGSLGRPCVEEAQDAALLEAVRHQVEEYLTGKRRRFDLPLHPQGTPFQRWVWTALEEIPFGETRSYGQIAARLGRPGGARAVGAACGKNPILLLIPCHRVVGTDGSLTGFAAGLDLKRRLLALEHEQGGKNP